MPETPPPGMAQLVWVEGMTSLPFLPRYSLGPKAWKCRAQSVMRHLPKGNAPQKNSFSNLMALPCACSEIGGGFRTQPISLTLQCCTDGTRDKLNVVHVSRLPLA